MRPLAVLVVALFAATANAQVTFEGSGNSHLQTIDYRTGDAIPLRAATGYQLMIELSPDEAVQNVAIGDGTAWQVSINKAGDRLFLKPTQVDAATNMTVVTTVRTYMFDLGVLAYPSGQTPYTVRFRYPTAPPDAGDAQFVDVSATKRRASRYRFGGARQLRPASVSNDGERTYVAWPKAAAIPAIYAQDPNGRETLANGMMGTDDVFVIDGVPPKLIFRIDSDLAWAVRFQTKRSR